MPEIEETDEAVEETPKEPEKSTFEKWTGWVEKVIEAFKSDLQEGELMEKYGPELSKMAATVVDVLEDGIQIEDFKALGPMVPQIMIIAAGIEGAPGEQKRRFVVDAVWIVYHALDTGPDGKQNRVKVPYLAWLSSIGISLPEEKLERFALKLATETAIDAAFDYMREKGVV